MGYDLKSKNGGSFGFNIQGWQSVLFLAELYGWEPKGTVMTEDNLTWAGLIDTAYIQEHIKSWDGSYCSNDFQTVAEEDALNLAHALMNALKELPDEKFYLDNYSIYTREGVVNSFSSLEGKNYLEEFIQFCRDGEFMIY